MSILLLLIGLGIFLWFWQDSLRAKELAREACLRACRRYGVQLLDDTVALDKLWLRRNNNGRLILERRYTFEFTNTGISRTGGVVVMVGNAVEILAMDGADLFIP
jgi:hypothetical protein